MSARTNGRIRLLHLVESGDTSGFFPQLARFADHRRFEVRFATLKSAQPALTSALQEAGVPLASFGANSRWRYPAAIASMRRFLRRESIAILHTHLFDPSVVGLVAGTLAGTPARVSTRHHSDYHTRIHRHAHVALDRLATRLSHAVIAVSRHTAEHLVAIEGADPAKVRTIPNGVDFARLVLSPPERRNELRASMASHNRRVALLPGRLHPEKGHSVLFEALQQADNWVALLAGDGPYRAAYEAEVQARGLAERVHFLGYRSDIADLMASVDCVVLPSVAEAFGLVLVEALYLGAPVVASAVGGVPEIVMDGVDGLLVPPGEPRALARALELLATDAGLRERLAGAGRERVAREFAFETMMRGYEALYGELHDRA